MVPFLLPHLVEGQAKARPRNVALQGRERSYSYAEIDDLATALASTLDEHGVGHRDRVGLYTSRSDESYISIFGILKAGATYVPLDSWAPLARVTRILTDCSASAIIVEAALLDNLLSSSLPSSLRLLVVIDGSGSPREIPGAALVAWKDAVDGEARRLQNPAIEEDLAAILYTSGSTGLPKGVMLSHRNILSFVNWAVDTFNVGSGDRVAGVTEFHFDLSIFDIFVTFAAGATLVPTGANAALRPTGLAVWMQDQEISIWYSTPSLLILLLTKGRLEEQKLSALRTVLFAGEVFAVKHLRQLRNLLPTVDLVNLYGPTETNVCTWHRVDSIPEGGLPIGAACANTEVSIRGKDGLVVSPGEQGELWVRGPLVMQGYWGNPEMTRAKLVAAPECMPWESQWYRTGDLVRRDGNGDIVYCGRIDHMVKVRGYRVELGEVEAVLYDHDSIKELAVAAATDNEGTCELHAFVVATSGESQSSVELKRYLGKRLPPYMIPSRISFLDELPKTSGGKVDRRKLVEWTSR